VNNVLKNALKNSLSQPYCSTAKMAKKTRKKSKIVRKCSIKKSVQNVEEETLKNIGAEIHLSKCHIFCNNL